MQAVKTLVRFFSYAFHGLLALFLAAVSGLVLISGAPSLNLGMLPWSGANLGGTTQACILFFSSILGLVIVYQAFRGIWRKPFFIWTLFVAVVLLRGYIFSSYRFPPGDTGKAFWLIGFSLIAVAGGWFQMRRKPAGYKR